jgi:leucyl aminopeptidase
VLGPEEFAERTQPLTKLGVEVEVLDVKALRKIGMKALLAVGQGSAARQPVVIMRWNGGKTGDAPVAFLARAWCSTRAASRSSRAAAWRT